MSAITRTFSDIECDICGKQTHLLAPDADNARKRARSWRKWRLRQNIYDTCPDCKPKEGWSRA